MSDDGKLGPLIDSVANGEPVDWEHAEGTAATPDERERLHALREVARLAEFHHVLQRENRPGAGHGDLERWGSLLVLERAGSGAGGDVFRAWDTTLQREVALKLVRARADGTLDSADWLEEARALARVRDPHVVTVFGAGEHDGRPGLWMEFLNGSTLESEIARRGPLPAAEVTRLGVQIGRALRAAHAAGTIHRDVKPANVVLEAGDRAVLTDFGLGQRRSAARSPSPFSGTPLFMSPQRLAGAAARPADDIYALGVTLHLALAGEAPFRADTLDQLREAAAAGPRDALRVRRPDAPAALVAAIERAMAPDAARRFESAAALVVAFEAVAATPREPARRTRRGLGLLVLAAIAIGTSLAVLTTRPRGRSAANSPPAPVRAAAGAYDVSAGFLRRGSTGDLPLETGDRVAPGDRLSLRFHSTRPVWVYVLDADERGENYLLFPQPMFDRKNPIPGDSTILLPGTRAGRENAWTVTSRGGREHLLVVASPQPMAELEDEIARLPAPAPGHPVEYAKVPARSMDRLRGMAGVSEVPAAATQAPARLFDRIRALAGDERSVRGPWIRQIVLENPLR